MTDRLTEERVRDIARDCFVAMVTLGEVEEIAREVLALREEGYAKRFSVEDQLAATKQILTATEARLAEALQQRDEAVALVEEAWKDGYDTGSDPWWCDKHLRRAGVRAEAHEGAARDHFWREADHIRARLALLRREGVEA